MNHLLTFKSLKNRYFIIRHGQSLANQQGLIVSTPENGIDGYGLSDHGKQQVKQSISKLKDASSISLIISSDFKRAYETAQISRESFTANFPEIILNASLRERNFGDFELSGNEHYQTVWDADALDANQTSHHVESAKSVMARVTLLIQSLEETYRDQLILLASHGDTLQILQTAFEKKPASLHRNLPPLETAEVRELLLAP